MPKLYDWQAKEVAEHGMDKKRALHVSPRLGKTLATIESMALWNFQKCLVVSPLIVCPQWAGFLQERGYRVIDLYSGTLKARISRLWDAMFDKDSPAIVAVANYDMLRTAAEDLAAWKPQAIIGDESHILGSHTSKRGKVFRKIAWRCEYVRLLTGTPTPNHYGNLWGQQVCLDKELWGASYEQFARRYLIRDTMFPTKVIGHRNTEELQQKMLRNTTVVRREDVFGADKWIRVTRTIQLPDKAREMYRKLVKEWVLDDERVEANHILKRMVRLQQLSAGFLPTEDGRVLAVHEAKATAVLADLGEIFASDEKVVLFHRFRWEGKLYADKVALAYPDTAVFGIDGDTPIGERARIVADFRDRQGPTIVVVQVQAGGVGISFATASHAMFTSRGFSFVDDEQARDRVFSPGLGRTVTYYECDKTVDQYIARALSTKQAIHESVVHADIEELAYGMIKQRKVA